MNTISTLSKERAIEILKENTDLRNKLSEALDRMDRARNILTDGNPRPECNWGLLDTKNLKT